MVKMKRFHGNVGSTQHSLKQRPEVFESLCVNLSMYVFLSVVHNFMHKVTMQVIESDSAIRIHCAAMLYVFKNCVLQCFALDVRDDLRTHLPQFPVKHAKDGCLVHVAITLPLSPSPLEVELPAAVHLVRVRPDKGFVAFNGAALCSAELVGQIALHGSPEAMKHKPCRLLCNAKRAVKFHAGDAVLAVDQHPECRHPLIESEGRILEDRSYLEGELLIAPLAEPNTPRFDEVIAVGIASRTGHFSVRPAQIFGILERTVGIGEVNDGLLQSLWNLHV